MGSGRPLSRQDLIILALFGFQGINFKERSRRIESYPEECGGDLVPGTKWNGSRESAKPEHWHACHRCWMTSSFCEEEGEEVGIGEFWKL